MAEKIFQQGVKHVESFRHKMTLMRLLIGCGCGEAELKTCKTYFLSLIKKKPGLSELILNSLMSTLWQRFSWDSKSRTESIHLRLISQFVDLECTYRCLDIT